MGKEPLEFSIDDVEGSDEVIVALRSVQQSQVRLNVLADQKANINIGFTLLFITLSQTALVMDAAQQANVLRWGLILVNVSVALSLTLALLVVSPRISGSRIKKADQMSNPFYFGMFTQLDQGSYVDYMLTHLTRNQQARRMMLVDVYQIGQVLKRKYFLLRLSYGFLALSGILSAVMLAIKTLVYAP